MDISCPTCGEPWDTYHLRYDEPHEWEAPPFMVKDFINGGSRFSGPQDPMRVAAEEAGWRFASSSVLSITHCPACKSQEPLPDASKRRQLVAVSALTNGDDDDGLAVELSEMDLLI